MYTDLLKTLESKEMKRITFNEYLENHEINKEKIVDVGSFLLERFIKQPNEIFFEYFPKFYFKCKMLVLAVLNTVQTLNA